MAKEQGELLAHEPERKLATEEESHLAVGANRGDLRPTEQFRSSRPEQQVVDEVRHRIAEARVEDDLVVNEQPACPVVAGKIARGARPERAERCTADSTELA